jgi:hypothetical protein
MSVTMEIFVRFKSPIFEDFRKEMEAALGITFQFMPDDNGDEYFDYYVFSSAHERITLSKAVDYVNDRDMNFEDYQYYVGVQATGWKYIEDRDRILSESSRSIFEKLKATGRYPLMMTYDVQRKLDEFQPKPSEAVNS